MPQILSRSVILLLLCGGVVPYLAQDSPSELDFLDKVENIKVPTKQEKLPSTDVLPVKSQKKTVLTSTKSNRNVANSKKSKKNKNSSLSSNKKTISTSPAKTVISGTSTQENTVKSSSNPDSSKPVNVETIESNVVKTNLNVVKPNLNSDFTSTNKTDANDSKVNNSVVTDSGSPELDASLWMDDSLAMQPNYLPGFDGSQSKPEETTSGGESKQENKNSSSDDKQTVYPLPHLTGNFSIWGSFVDFLSKYQKAFYIFGILILFGLYRLRAGGGGSSSSRKSSPTIRRLRR